MMIIPLELRLAVALENMGKNIDILRVDLIDDDNNTSQDITQYLKEKGVLNNHSSLSEVLRRIIKEALDV